MRLQCSWVTPNTYFLAYLLSIHARAFETYHDGRGRKAHVEDLLHTGLGAHGAVFRSKELLEITILPSRLCVMDAWHNSSNGIIGEIRRTMPRVPISEFECPICHTRVKTETGVYRIFTNCTNCGYGMVDRFTPDNTKELQRFAQYHKVGRVTGRWLPKKWYLSNGDEIIPAVGKGGKLVWLRRKSGHQVGTKGVVPGRCSL